MMNTLTNQRNWQAHLQLEFKRRSDRTLLSKNLHYGPLVVQKPFYPGDGACHVYLLHPPGGLVGGDQLQVEINATESSHALITTPAANKFYRSAGLTASIEQRINVSRDSQLEWLPQETILYRDAHARMVTRVAIEPGGRFIGWEILCLGRPAAQESFDRGHCEQRIEIWRDDQPLMIERNAFGGNASVRTAQWGYAQQPVSATMIATPLNESDFSMLRDSLLPNIDSLFSVTLINDILVARYLGAHVWQASHYFQTIWRALRPHIIGVPAMMPRIWAT